MITPPRVKKEEDVAKAIEVWEEEIRELEDCGARKRPPRQLQRHSIEEAADRIHNVSH